LALPAKDGDGDEKAGARKSRFALAEGNVVVTFPESPSADSVEDLDGFCQLFIKKVRRPKLAPSEEEAANEAPLARFLSHNFIIVFEALRERNQGMANAHDGGGALD